MGGKDKTDSVLLKELEEIWLNKSEIHKSANNIVFDLFGEMGVLAVGCAFMTFLFSASIPHLGEWMIILEFLFGLALAFFCISCFYLARLYIMRLFNNNSYDVTYTFVSEVKVAHKKSIGEERTILGKDEFVKYMDKEADMNGRKKEMLSRAKTWYHRWLIASHIAGYSYIVLLVHAWLSYSLGRWIGF